MRAMAAAKAMHTMIVNTAGPVLAKTLPTPSSTRPERTRYTAFQLADVVASMPLADHQEGA